MTGPTYPATHPPELRSSNFVIPMQASAKNALASRKETRPEVLSSGLVLYAGLGSAGLLRLVDHFGSYFGAFLATNRLSRSSRSDIVFPISDISSPKT